MSGDLIKSLNGTKIDTIDKLLIEYQINYGKTLELEILRNGEIKKVTITPYETEDGYSYGFSLDSSVKYGFFEGIKYGFSKVFSLIEQMFLVITYLITGKLSLSNLSGPVGIYNIVGESAKAGLINLIYFTGYLSINVGFINLLPIPAFDGGRILFLVIEKIRRKPIKPEIENTIHGVGLVLLMILMVVITYNDIIRFFIN